MAGGAEQARPEAAVPPPAAAETTGPGQTGRETRAGLVPWGHGGLKVRTATACDPAARGELGLAKLPMAAE